MNTLFKSDHSLYMGYPDPHDVWTETDLWEWVDAGRPGNPPWNPDGVRISTAGKTPQEVEAEKAAVIDASGNRKVYELHQLGRKGSQKRSQYDASQVQQAIYRKQVMQRRLLLWGGVGLAALLLMGGAS